MQRLIFLIALFSVTKQPDIGSDFLDHPKGEGSHHIEDLRHLVYMSRLREGLV